MAQSKIQSVENIAQYKIKLPNLKVVTTKVGPGDTCRDVEARVAKEHGLLGQLTWHSPGDARDVNKLWKENQGSHLVIKIFPNTSLFVISDNKAVKAKADPGTEKHDYAVDDNFADQDGDQENGIWYPEQHPGRDVESKARVCRNIATDKAKQKNFIGGPRNAV